MTIPATGAFTSEQVRAEWSGSLPMTSAQVAAWAGLSGAFTSDQLRGKSAATVSISQGNQTTTRVGGVASTNFRTQRILTPVHTGYTPASYVWSITASIAGLSTTTGATSAVFIIYDDVETGPLSDTGTINLAVTDTNGVVHYATTSFILN